MRLEFVGGPYDGAVIDDKPQEVITFKRHRLRTRALPDGSCECWSEIYWTIYHLIDGRYVFTCDT